MARTILPKMSIKTLGANGAVVLVTKTKTPLVRIKGIARGIKVANGNDGSPVFGMTGQFIGLNIADGTEFESGVLYLPGGINEMFLSPLEAALNEDKSATIKFALDLFAVPATNKAGYSFEAASLIAATNVDPFAEMSAEADKTAIPAMPKLPGAADVEKAKEERQAVVEGDTGKGDAKS